MMRYAPLVLLALFLGLGGQKISQAITSQARLTSHQTNFAPVTPAACPAPVASLDTKHDTSPPIKTLSPQPINVESTVRSRRRLEIPKNSLKQVASADAPDPVLQETDSPLVIPTPKINIDGISNADNAPYKVVPPDTEGDVGKTHYVQWVNLSLAIWQLDRATNTATKVYGPVPGNTLWSGFGGPCQDTNDGDPIVLYDELAGRWFASQFAIPNDPNGPYYQCIAVSASEDPTGAWHRYQFKYSDTKLNDYAKFGVWPDAYYMSANQFYNGLSWSGVGVIAFERSKMLQGLPARQVYFDLGQVNSLYSSLLPADLDAGLPPAGTPGYFLEVEDGADLSGYDALYLWEFRVNWASPGDSRFGADCQPNKIIPVAEFTPLCPAPGGCIPQPPKNDGLASPRLDEIGDRLMHRVQYRQFGGYATMVANHTVDVGSSRGGVRWYDLRNTGSGWAIQQQGTYGGSPLDSANRWMGSIAMDSAGNIAIGYSVSSAAVYPSVRYTGRLAGDVPGTLPQGEATLINGQGVQVGTTTSNEFRWGDYSMMSVDPSDGCTFWYTNEYYPKFFGAETPLAWRTRIGSFVFPGCLDVGNITGKTLEDQTGQTLPGAKVEAAPAGGAQPYQATSNSLGEYFFNSLPSGVYTLTAMLPGYYPTQITGVQVQKGQTTLQDLALIPYPYKIKLPIVAKGVTP